LSPSAIRAGARRTQARAGQASAPQPIAGGSPTRDDELWSGRRCSISGRAAACRATHGAGESTHRFRAVAPAKRVRSGRWPGDCEVSSKAQRSPPGATHPAGLCAHPAGEPDPPGRPATASTLRPPERPGRRPSARCEPESNRAALTPPRPTARAGGSAVLCASACSWRTGSRGTKRGPRARLGQLGDWGGRRDGPSRAKACRQVHRADAQSSATAAGGRVNTRQARPPASHPTEQPVRLWPPGWATLARGKFGARHPPTVIGQPGPWRANLQAQLAGGSGPPPETRERRQPRRTARKRLHRWTAA